jgi:Flp pilus assembly protein TadD
MISSRHYHSGVLVAALLAVVIAIAGMAGCASAPSTESRQPVPAPVESAARAPSAPATTTPPQVGTSTAGTATAGVQTTAAVAGPVVPPRATSQFNQALALLAAGKTEDAELELKTLIVAFPELPAPHVNLGLLFLRSARLDDAEKEFKAALEHSAEDAHALNGLGLVYRRTGRFPDAEKAYSQAIAADPAYTNAYRNLAVLYDLYMQTPERALPLYQKYQELSGGTDNQVGEWIKDVTRRAGSAQKPTESKTP